MRLYSLLRENLLASTLGVVVLVQMPFTILYFSAKPAPADLSGGQVKHAGRPAAKPAPIPPNLPAREDPFKLLPGMGEKPLASADEPQIFEAFREPALPAGLKSGQAGNTEPQEIAIQPLPLPPSSTTSARPTNLKLTGIVRYHGKAMAVLQLQDKSTVYTGEGERIAGTDCYVQTILGTKVRIGRQVDGRTNQEWLYVGEELRA